MRHQSRIQSLLQSLNKQELSSNDAFDLLQLLSEDILAYSIKNREGVYMEFMGDYLYYITTSKSSKKDYIITELMATSNDDNFQRKVLKSNNKMKEVTESGYRNDTNTMSPILFRIMKVLFNDIDDINDYDLQENSVDMYINILIKNEPKPTFPIVKSEMYHIIHSMLQEPGKKVKRKLYFDVDKHITIWYEKNGDLYDFFYICDTVDGRQSDACKVMETDYLKFFELGRRSVEDAFCR